MESLGVYNEVLDVSLRGQTALYSSGNLLSFLHLFRQKTEAASRQLAQTTFARGVTTSTINQISLTVQAFLVILIMFMVIRGQLDAFYFPMFLPLMNMIIYPMYEIISAWSTIRSTRSITNKLIGELNEAVEWPENSVPAEASSGDVCFRDLSFAYGDRVIFQDVNLCIADGEHILLRGGSGSGKSTLLRILAKQLSGYQGEITINQKSLRDFTRQELFNQVSVVSQHPMIFRDTIKQNIVLFEDEKLFNQERLDQAIHQSGLRQFIDTLPEGINTVLRDSGENLSGGEKQRIDLARAFYRQSNILLVDEVTSGLDLTLAKEIEEILNNSEATIISTSHRYDIDLAKYYNRTIQLVDQTLKPL